MKKLLLFSFYLFVFIAFAQKNTSWRHVDISKIDFKNQNRKPNLPTEFSIFEFDYNSFVTQLQNVPKRNDFNGISNVIVSFPMPNGKFVNYRIVEAPTFDEILQARFPNIRSFAGNEVNNPSNVIRFSVSTEMGISATVRSASEQTTFIIDPFSMDYKQFIVFDRSKSTDSKNSFKCSTIDEIKQFGPVLENKAGNQILNNADDSRLRVFQLAQSCTAEYANAFGATSSAQVNLVLAAYNNTLTRVNAIYEQDFNVTMVIINESTNVIYYNPTTDPYSDGATGSGGAWNVELQNNLNNNLTGLGTSLAANNAVYDIGHLFGASGGGGNAGCIGCVCVNPTADGQKQKGSGFTSPGSGLPQGDTFDIDYVAHECGHQFGGNHTFTHSTEDNTVNVEPGSGITIMAYAGITEPATNVASNSIAIFHAASIQQITNNVKTKTCDDEVIIANAVPIPVAPVNLTLPIGTAFKLVGTASDLNPDDLLSYSWEQIDNANGAANLCGQTPTSSGDSDCIPTGADIEGPNFRSFMPSNSGTRMFPRLADHLVNGVTGNAWEVLPNVARVMNFRFTVRDNRLGGGNNESVNTAVTFDATKGPFLITSQNVAGLSYNEGSTQTVTWSVNNTNTMTGATNVNIKLSIDGGYTYPFTLVSGTPNDGSQSVSFPVGVTAPKCRILIEPTANNFYAINTKDFAIGFSVATQCFTYNINLASPINITNALTWYNSNFSITDSFILNDVNITTAVTHNRRNEIYARLVKSGTPNKAVYLFQQGGCANNIANLNGTFDDESANAAGCGATNNFGNMKPLESLSGFDGLYSNGNWTLQVADVTDNGFTGSINSYSIELCKEVVTETPVACGVNTTTWNGSSWSNGVPSKNVAVIFNGNFNSTANLEACSLTVNSGFNVVINSGHTFVVGNEVIVNGLATLTVNNDAALRQLKGTAINSGNIIVKRNSAGMIRLDYTAWGSPVSGQNLKNFSPNTLDNRFYQYLYTGTTTPTAYQSVPNVTTTNFTVGKGYMIRSANDWPTTSTVFNGQFTGVPFNGDLSVNVGRGYNLLGNPYASPIDATKLLNDNSTTLGAIYFWTHTVPASGGVYPQNNYASYTLIGGTAAAAGGVIPNGYVQTGQGFFVRTYDFGSIKFNNNQRVNASTSTQFYRMNSIETSINQTERHRIWLNFKNNESDINQVLVGYSPSATNGYDFGYDGEILDNSSSMLYYPIADKNCVIQGKGLPFATSDEILLGYKALTPGTYTISLENVDGLFVNQNVFIKDNMTNEIHDIKNKPYQFATTEGNFKNRLSLVFKNSKLSTNELINDDQIVVFSQNNQLKINAPIDMINITVFDVLGRILEVGNEINDKQFVTKYLNSKNQTLIVKIDLSNGQSISKKVMN